MAIQPNFIRLERDDFGFARHHALGYWWSMIFSENRYTLFGIMLSGGLTITARLS
jgi:hypothetical protein